nr:disease resistance protein RGA2-like [Solanum lycopersicum]
MVFNDQRITEHFHPRIWICVSEYFNEKRLIKEIVEFIEGRPLLGEMNLAPLQMKLQELLNGKRYLLVLDDVWNEDQDKWANLRQVLKVGASGASVITTTRLEKVGSTMGTLQPFRFVKFVSGRLLVVVLATCIWTPRRLESQPCGCRKGDCEKKRWCASSSQDSWRYFARGNMRVI